MAPLRRSSLPAWRGRADANADAPPTAGLVAPGELDGQQVPAVPSAETAAGLVPYSDSDSSGDEGEEPPQKRQKPRALQDKTNAPVEPQPASVPEAEVRGSPRRLLAKHRLQRSPPLPLLPALSAVS